MNLEDWHLTQNENYLSLITSRLDGPDLIWCTQFNQRCEEIALNFERKIEIVDYGCNVGQFCKVINKEKFDYLGVDLSETYIQLAKMKFPNSNFHILNLDNIDVAVISATLEHTHSPYTILDKILKSVRYSLLLRTFVGKIDLKDSILKFGANKPYIVWQFSIDSISELATNNNFSLDIHVDDATKSLPYEIENNRQVIRKMFFLEFTKTQ